MTVNVKKTLRQMDGKVFTSDPFHILYNVFVSTEGTNPTKGDRRVHGQPLYVYKNKGDCYISYGD